MGSFSVMSNSQMNTRFNRPSSAIVAEYRVRALRCTLANNRERLVISLMVAIRCADVLR